MKIRYRYGERIRCERGFLFRLILLAFFFSVGVFLGQVLSKRIPNATADELTRYLKDYLSLSGKKDFSAKSFLSSLLLYFRYPLLAFLLGFASVGVVLLPAVSTAFGFFLSFSVCCFTATFGNKGVLLSLAVFGLRCLITLPCFFFLAVPSFRNSVTLASLSFGHGKHLSPVHYGADWWLRGGVVAVLLIVGAFAEMFLTPHLLNMVLEKIV